jgi:hypothetical protein
MYGRTEMYGLGRWAPRISVHFRTYPYYEHAGVYAREEP